jgi:glycosyltransferase involved in cell wall biosynthesis
MQPSTLFLQNRTHRAGAQTSLARVLKHEKLRRWNPTLVCSRGGWLAEECERQRVSVIQEDFPRSRSLAGRLFGNAAFARRIAGRLSERSIHAAIVQANDHQEGLLGLEVARRTGARTAMFLRSIALRREDYFKYRCNEYDVIFAVGDELVSRVQTWDAADTIELIHDGVTDEDFLPAKTRSESAPRRVLVIGSAQELKGWADVIDALEILEQEGALRPMQFDFTGSMPEATENDLKLWRLGAARCNFLGRVDAFRELVRDYDLVVNPSRMETFGMAAVEVLAAGVPLLSSRTGVMEQVQEASEMLFTPARPDQLASALKRLLQEWPQLDPGVTRSQENIRRRFMIDRTVDAVIAAYDGLLGAKPSG